MYKLNAMQKKIVQKAIQIIDKGFETQFSCVALDLAESLKNNHKQYEGPSSLKSIYAIFYGQNPNGYGSWHNWDIKFDGMDHDDLSLTKEQRLIMLELFLVVNS